MSIHYGPTCTCYRVWQSITPPPPCPAHGTPMRTSISWTTSLTRRCQGRHCAHSAECGTYIAINGGLRG